jgi:hypothetical protein
MEVGRLVPVSPPRCRARRTPQSRAADARLSTQRQGVAELMREPAIAASNEDPALLRGPKQERHVVRGAWSSYWYNNVVFESEITKGLNVFRVSDPSLAGARQLGRLPPQTEEFSLG